MKDFELADRLNKLNNADSGCDCGKNHALPVTFYGGDFTVRLDEILSKVAPSGRVVVIATESVYLEYYKKIQSALKTSGSRLAGMVINPAKNVSVDGASELFNLPEDTRAVIIFEKQVFDYSAYYASVKDLPLIVIPTTPILDYALSTATCLLNGKVVDRVNILAKRHIIIDYKLVNETPIAESYAHLASILPTLADYRFYCAVNNVTPCKYAYALAKKSLTLALNAFKLSSGLMPLIFAECSAYFGIANGVTGGALNDFSAVNTCAKLLSHETAGCKLYLSVKLLGIYNLMLNGGYDKLIALTDYAERAKVFSQKYPFPEEQLISCLITQIRAIRRGEKKLTATAKQLAPEISANVKYAENLIKIYRALGGKPVRFEDKALVNAVKRGGDAPYFLNGLSIARSTGILEYV